MIHSHRWFRSLLKSRCFRLSRLLRSLRSCRYCHSHRLIQKLRCIQLQLRHLIRLIQKLHLIRCFRSIPMLLNALLLQ